MSKCLSCGIPLQTTDENKAGYILEKVFDKQICRRCYKLQHYGIFKPAEVMSNEKIIAKINEKSDLTFFLVDLLNINFEVMQTFFKISFPKVLVISKVDYLPKDFKYQKISTWLKQEYGITEEIIYLSSKKNYHLKALEDKIMELKAHQVYLSGYTNAGKSSLINAWQEQAKLTVSNLPNTTLDFVKLKNLNYTLIDSPGFNYETNLFLNNETTYLKQLNPSSYLRPITYQLKPYTSIIIADKIRLENGPDKLNIVCYFSNLLNLKKVYQNNNTLKELESVPFSLKNNQDLVIKGLGFINIKSNGDFKVYLSDSHLLEIRNSFF